MENDFSLGTSLNEAPENPWSSLYQKQFSDARTQKLAVESAGKYQDESAAAFKKAADEIYDYYTQRQQDYELHPQESAHRAMNEFYPSPQELQAGLEDPGFLKRFAKSAIEGAIPLGLIKFGSKKLGDGTVAGAIEDFSARQQADTFGEKLAEISGGFLGTLAGFMLPMGLAGKAVGVLWKGSAAASKMGKIGKIGHTIESNKRLGLLGTKVNPLSVEASMSAAKGAGLLDDAAMATQRMSDYNKFMATVTKKDKFLFHMIDGGMKNAIAFPLHANLMADPEYTKMSDRLSMSMLVEKDASIFTALGAITHTSPLLAIASIPAAFAVGYGWSEEHNRMPADERFIHGALFAAMHAIGVRGSLKNFKNDYTKAMDDMAVPNPQELANKIYNKVTDPNELPQLKLALERFGKKPNEVEAIISEARNIANDREKAAIKRKEYVESIKNEDLVTEDGAKKVAEKLYEFEPDKDSIVKEEFIEDWKIRLNEWGVGDQTTEAAKNMRDLRTQHNADVAIKAIEARKQAVLDRLQGAEKNIGSEDAMNLLSDDLAKIVMGELPPEKSQQLAGKISEAIKKVFAGGSQKGSPISGSGEKVKAARDVYSTAVAEIVKVAEAHRKTKITEIGASAAPDVLVSNPKELRRVAVELYELQNLAKMPKENEPGSKAALSNVKSLERIILSEGVENALLRGSEKNQAASDAMKASSQRFAELNEKLKPVKEERVKPTLKSREPISQGEYDRYAPILEDSSSRRVLDKVKKFVEEYNLTSESKMTEEMITGAKSGPLFDVLSKLKNESTAEAKAELRDVFGIDMPAKRPKKNPQEMLDDAVAKVLETTKLSRILPGLWVKLQDARMQREFIKEVEASIDAQIKKLPAGGLEEVVLRGALELQGGLSDVSKLSRALSTSYGINRGIPSTLYTKQGGASSTIGRTIKALEDKKLITTISSGNKYKSIKLTQDGFAELMNLDPSRYVNSVFVFDGGPRSGQRYIFTGKQGDGNFAFTRISGGREQLTDFDWPSGLLLESARNETVDIVRPHAMADIFGAASRILRRDDSPTHSELGKLFSIILGDKSVVSEVLESQRKRTKAKQESEDSDTASVPGERFMTLKKAARSVSEKETSRGARKLDPTEELAHGFALLEMARIGNWKRAKVGEKRGKLNHEGAILDSVDTIAKADLIDVEMAKIAEVGGKGAKDQIYNTVATFLKEGFMSAKNRAELGDSLAFIKKSKGSVEALRHAKKITSLVRGEVEEITNLRKELFSVDSTPERTLEVVDRFTKIFSTEMETYQKKRDRYLDTLSKNEYVQEISDSFGRPILEDHLNWETLAGFISHIRKNVGTLVVKDANKKHLMSDKEGGTNIADGLQAILDTEFSTRNIYGWEGKKNELAEKVEKYLAREILGKEDGFFSAPEASEVRQELLRYIHKEKSIERQTESFETLIEGIARSETEKRMRLAQDGDPIVLEDMRNAGSAYEYYKEGFDAAYDAVQTSSDIRSKKGSLITTEPGPGQAASRMRFERGVKDFYETLRDGAGMSRLDAGRIATSLYPKRGYGTDKALSIFDDARREVSNHISSIQISKEKIAALVGDRETNVEAIKRENENVFGLQNQIKSIVKQVRDGRYGEGLSQERFRAEVKTGENSIEGMIEGVHKYFESISSGTGVDPMSMTEWFIKGAASRMERSGSKIDSFQNYLVDEIAIAKEKFRVKTLTQEQSDTAYGEARKKYELASKHFADYVDMFNRSNLPAGVFRSMGSSVKMENGRQTIDIKYPHELKYEIENPVTKQTQKELFEMSVKFRLQADIAKEMADTMAKGEDRDAHILNVVIPALREAEIAETRARMMSENPPTIGEVMDIQSDRIGREISLDPNWTEGSISARNEFVKSIRSVVNKAGKNWDEVSSSIKMELAGPKVEITKKKIEALQRMAKSVAEKMESDTAKLSIVSGGKRKVYKLRRNAMKEIASIQSRIEFAKKDLDKLVKSGVGERLDSRKAVANYVSRSEDSVQKLAIAVARARVERGLLKSKDSTPTKYESYLNNLLFDVHSILERGGKSKIPEMLEAEYRKSFTETMKQINSRKSAEFEGDGPKAYSGNDVKMTDAERSLNKMRSEFDMQMLVSQAIVGFKNIASDAASRRPKDAALEGGAKTYKTISERSEAFTRSASQGGRLDGADYSMLAEAVKNGDVSPGEALLWLRHTSVGSPIDAEGRAIDPAFPGVFLRSTAKDQARNGLMQAALSRSAVIKEAQKPSAPGVKKSPVRPVTMSQKEVLELNKAHRARFIQEIASLDEFLSKKVGKKKAEGIRNERAALADAVKKIDAANREIRKSMKVLKGESTSNIEILDSVERSGDAPVQGRARFEAERAEGSQRIPVIANEKPVESEQSVAKVGDRSQAPKSKRLSSDRSKFVKELIRRQSEILEKEAAFEKNKGKVGRFDGVASEALATARKEIAELNRGFKGAKPSELEAVREINNQSIKDNKAASDSVRSLEDRIKLEKDPLEQLKLEGELAMAKAAQKRVESSKKSNAAIDALLNRDKEPLSEAQEKPKRSIKDLSPEKSVKAVLDKIDSIENVNSAELRSALTKYLRRGEPNMTSDGVVYARNLVRSAKTPQEKLAANERLEQEVEASKVQDLNSKERALLEGIKITIGGKKYTAIDVLEAGNARSVNEKIKSGFWNRDRLQRESDQPRVTSDVMDRQADIAAKKFGGTVSGSIKEPGGEKVITKGGMTVRIINDPSIEANGVNRQLTKDGKVIGYEVRINPDRAKGDTVFHETTAGHMAWDFMTDLQRKALGKHYGEKTEEGIVQRLGEDFTNGRLRGEPRGYLKRVFGKIKEFIESITGGRLFSGERAKNTLSDVASGKIFEGEARVSPEFRLQRSNPPTFKEFRDKFARGTPRFNEFKKEFQNREDRSITSLSEFYEKKFIRANQLNNLGNEFKPVIEKIKPRGTGPIRETVRGIMSKSEQGETLAARIGLGKLWRDTFVRDAAEKSAEVHVKTHTFLEKNKDKISSVNPNKRVKLSDSTGKTISATKGQIIDIGLAQGRSAALDINGVWDGIKANNWDSIESALSGIDKSYHKSIKRNIAKLAGVINDNGVGFRKNPDGTIMLDPKYSKNYWTGYEMAKFSADSIKKMHDSADAKEVDFYDNVVRPYYDTHIWPSLEKAYRDVNGKGLEKEFRYVQTKRLWEPSKDPKTKTNPQTVTEQRSIDELEYRSLEDMGSLQSRGYSTSPVIMKNVANSLSVSARETGQYVGYARPVSEWRNALQQNKAAIIERMGPEMTDTLFKTLDRLEGNAERVGDVERLMNRQLDRFTTATLGMNPAIALYQPISVLSYAREFGGGNLAKALAMRFTPEGNKIAKDIMSRSYSIRERMLGSVREADLFDTTSGRSEIEGITSPWYSRAKAVQVMMKPIELADRAAVKTGVLAAYFKGKELGLEGDALLNYAAKEGAAATHATQTSGLDVARNEWRSSANPWKRALTFMSGGMNSSYNMVMRDLIALKHAGFRGHAETKNLAVSLSAVVAATAVISGIQTYKEYIVASEDDRKKLAKQTNRALYNFASGLAGHLPASSMYANTAISLAARALGDAKQAAQYANLETRVPYDMAYVEFNKFSAAVKQYNDAKRGYSIDSSQGPDNVKRIKVDKRKAKEAHQKMLRSGWRLTELMTGLSGQRAFDQIEGLTR